MAVTALKTWVAGEVLTATDLNNEFLNIINGDQSLGTPRSAAFDMNGQALILDADADTTMAAGTDDQVTFALGGTNTVVFYTNRIEVLGNRVLTSVDGRRYDGVAAKASELEQRINQRESDGILESQIFS